MMEHESFNFLLLVFLSILPTYLQVSCDKLIESPIVGSKNGTLASPNYPSNYPADYTCVYRLIGLRSERVRVEFRDFNVKGVPPKCSQDYVELFAQSTNAFENLVDQILDGRYCGTDLTLLPAIIISMNNILIVAFFTDHIKQLTGFSFDYAFIDNSMYVSGTASPEQPCQQTIYGLSKPFGDLYSPTYPGVYPDNIYCFFRLIGVPGQRVKLMFEIIDMFSGGVHCPYDYIRLYDGASNNSRVIDTFCGYHSNQTIFSSSSYLFLEFITRQGREETGRKTYDPPSSQSPLPEKPQILKSGFKATYVISNEFVDLAFIEDGEHLIGTECDQRVLSRKESSGSVTSPGYPGKYPLNVLCYYFLDGMEHQHNLEKTKLTIETLSIPTINNKCHNGYLSAYLRGQRNSPDRQICGNVPPSSLTSSHPRLLLLFNTLNANNAGFGFKARIDFLTDFAIPGTPAADYLKCQFTYHSSSVNHGTFNSPRHPSNYPDDAVCLYEFFPRRSEQVRITFETFKLEDSGNCSSSSDLVLIFNVFSLSPTTPFHDTSSFFLHPSTSQQMTNLLPSSTNPYISPSDWLIGIHCSDSLPGPKLSEPDTASVKVLFVTNDHEVNSGFKAKYEFIERKMHDQKCFYNVSNDYGGQFSSPNFPHKYPINSTCEWYISTKLPTSRILLQFVYFTMEGSKKKHGGCGNAVLSVYLDNTVWPSLELCGMKKEGSTLLSLNHFLRLKFVSSARAIGSKGFKVTWTEVLSISHDGSECSEFHCKKSGYCIPSVLRCNGIPNCGTEDHSDEVKNCGDYKQKSFFQKLLSKKLMESTLLLQAIVVLSVLSLIAMVVVVVCIVHKRRSYKRNHKTSVEVRYLERADDSLPPSPSFPHNSTLPYNLTHFHNPNHLHTILPHNSTIRSDRRIMREQTEKVSIV